MRRHDRNTRRRPSKPRGRAFTMVELLIVVAIIGIVVALILTAAQAGVRRSEERATQALITKLESALLDRIDALSAQQVDANNAHAFLAQSLFSANGSPVASNGRAQTIARFDLIKAEVPDVFVVQSDPKYPLNFAAAPFPGGAGSAFYSVSNPYYCQYMLPFGAGMALNPPNSYGAASTNATTGVTTPTVTGIFGASFTAAGGLYKNLLAQAVAHGASPPNPANAGYDGVDNNGDGLIDDILENGSAASAMVTLLGNHTHKTARSEMLYALLVEGQGPLGSAFNRDDFSDREVQDTDGDGLPEFVDAWGQPLQFYRWPVFYPTDTQKGAQLYKTPITMSSGPPVSIEPRQKYTLDPSLKLVDPAWWSGVATSTPYTANLSTLFGSAQSPLSGSAYAFQALFTTLSDPNYRALAPYPNAQLWERGASWPARREFYCRFLILSGGPDKLPGVPVFDPTWWTTLLNNYSGFSVSASTNVTTAMVPGVLFGSTTSGGAGPIGVATDVAPSAANMQYIQMLRIESQAAPATYFRSDTITYGFTSGGVPVAYPGGSPTFPTSNLDVLSNALYDAGLDDISNANLQAPGGATQ